MWSDLRIHRWGDGRGYVEGHQQGPITLSLVNRGLEEHGQDVTRSRQLRTPGWFSACLPGSAAGLGGAARALCLARRSAAGSTARPKPDSLFSDRGYDLYRDQVRGRGIVPAIAHRGTRHGTGHLPGGERTFAWLHGFRRLRIRWERRADLHEAFLELACCLITQRQTLFLTCPADSRSVSRAPAD